MKTARFIDTNIEYHQTVRPSIEVEYGERFLVQTELCSGPWLQNEHSVWAKDKEIPGNILTCVKINNAVPGDILAVHINNIHTADIAFGGLEGVLSFPYPKVFIGNEYDESSFVHVIKKNKGQFAFEGTGFDSEPMIGCIGTARLAADPAKEIPDICGGNLDVREINKGCSVYLPVKTESALLFFGDVHAFQGDGEITGWGAECRGVIDVSVDKAKPLDFQVEYAVLAENEESLIAIGFGEGFERAYNSSVKALMDYSAHYSNRSRKDVCVRMGFAMRCHIAQSCFPEWPVFVAKIPKRYLEKL